MSGTLLGIVALLLTTAAIALWIRAIKTVAVGSSRIWYIGVFVVTTCISIASFSLGSHWVGDISAGLSIFVAMFFFLTAAIGPQKVGAGALTVGSMLPPFSGNDEHGNHFDSSQLMGQPVLIKFFRGHW